MLQAVYVGGVLVGYYIYRNFFDKKKSVVIPYQMVYDYVASLKPMYQGKIPLLFIMAIIEIESARRQYAKGSADEVGMMQLKAGAVADTGLPYQYPDDLWDWKINIECGIAYLVSIYNHYDQIGWNDSNKVRQVVVTYNAGYGNYANGNYTYEYWDLVHARRNKLITQGGI